MPEPTYTVWVTTGDVALGGTDSNVFIMLFGEAGQTDWIHLPPEDVFAFEQGSTDKFVLVAPDVGKQGLNSGIPVLRSHPAGHRWNP